MKKNMYLNLTLTFLFACLMASTSFAQWTDGGTYIRTDDNVTVGSNSNSYSLYVRKDKTGWQGRFANRSGVGADVYLSHGTGYGMNVIGRTSDGKYTLRLARGNTTHGQATHMFYNDGRAALGLQGNVGIGTTNPVGKLHINAGSGEGLRITSSNGNTHIPFTNGWSYLSGKVLVFRTDGNNERMRIDIDGNVGIGTTTPGNKLEVNGTIRAREIIVETVNWPDYVFYDNYDLPTLEEEEKHIEENGHLLGFESEKDMAGEIQLGDVSKRQQVKLEEVILHLIDIKKEVVKLNSKIAELEEENEQLKEQISKK